MKIGQSISFQHSKLVVSSVTTVTVHSFIQLYFLIVLSFTEFILVCGCLNVSGGSTGF